MCKKLHLVRQKMLVQRTKREQKSVRVCCQKFSRKFDEAALQKRQWQRVSPPALLDGTFSRTLVTAARRPSKSKVTTMSQLLRQIRPGIVHNIVLCAVVGFSN